MILSQQGEKENYLYLPQKDSLQRNAESGSEF